MCFHAASLPPFALYLCHAIRSHPLQLLLSIQSQILVSEPYANEPSFENTRSPQGKRAVAMHNAQLRLAALRHGMLDALKRPPPGFDTAVKLHFWLKRGELRAQMAAWLGEVRALAAHEAALSLRWHAAHAAWRAAKEAELAARAALLGWLTETDIPSHRVFGWLARRHAGPAAGGGAGILGLREAVPGDPDVHFFASAVAPQQARNSRRRAAAAAAAQAKLTSRMMTAAYAPFLAATAGLPAYAPTRGSHYAPHHQPPPPPVAGRLRVTVDGLFQGNPALTGSTAASSSSSSSAGAGLGASGAGAACGKDSNLNRWTCPVCVTPNKLAAPACVACTMPRPASVASGSASGLTPPASAASAIAAKLTAKQAALEAAKAAAVAAPAAPAAAPAASDTSAASGAAPATASGTASGSGSFNPFLPAAVASLKFDFSSISVPGQGTGSGSGSGSSAAAPATAAASTSAAPATLAASSGSAGAAAPIFDFSSISVPGSGSGKAAATAKPNAKAQGGSAATTAASSSTSSSSAAAPAFTSTPGVPAGSALLLEVRRLLGGRMPSPPLTGSAARSVLAAVLRAAGLRALAHVCVRTDVAQVAQVGKSEATGSATAASSSSSSSPAAAGSEASGSSSAAAAPAAGGAGAGSSGAASNSAATGKGAATSSSAAGKKGKGKAAKTVLPASWDLLAAPSHLLASASASAAASSEAGSATDASAAAAGGAGAASASAAASESGRLAGNPFPITIAANSLLSGAGIDSLLASVHGAFTALAAANASWPDVAALVKAGEPTGALFIVSGVLNNSPASTGGSAGAGTSAGAGAYGYYGGASAAAGAIGIASPTATASAASAGAASPASPSSASSNPPSLTYPLGMREPPAFLRSPEAALAMLESMKARNVHESPQIGSTAHGGGIVPGGTLQSLLTSVTGYGGGGSAATSVPSYGFYDPVMTLLLYGGSLASLGIHTGAAGGAGGAAGMGGGLAAAMGMGMGMGMAGMFGDDEEADEMYAEMYAEAAAAAQAAGGAGYGARRGAADAASGAPSDDGWSAARTTVARALAAASREVRFGDLAAAMEQAVAELLGLLDAMPCPVTDDDLDRVGVPVPAGGVAALLQ